MRLTIILLLVSAVCFGQGKPSVIPTTNSRTISGSIIDDLDSSKTTKPTTMDTLKAPLISILEVQDFLFAINRKFVAMRELDLIKENEYKQLIGELNKIVAVLEKKKKTFK